MRESYPKGAIMKERLVVVKILTRGRVKVQSEDSPYYKKGITFASC